MCLNTALVLIVTCMSIYIVGLKLQERLQALRQSVADFKNQNSGFQDRLHNFTHDLEEAEVRKAELENQVKSLQQVSPEYLH